MKALFPCQSFTSSAAQGQGTGSNTISGRLFLPSQLRTAAQLSVPLTIAKDGHRQCASVLASSMKPQGCSTVNNSTPNKQMGDPDISLLSPRLQSLWDHARNTHLGNIVVKAQSNLHMSWACPECPDGHPHKWTARIDNVTRSRGCPFCSGQEVCPHNSLPRKAPHFVPEWDTAKNPGSPHGYTSKSHHRAHWKCHRGHQWQARIASRVERKTGCPVCAKTRPKQRLPALTASTSKVMQLWDWEQNTNAKLDPSKLTCGSNKQAHFKCGQCAKLQPHKWSARIQDVVKGSGCPYCSSCKVCKCNSLRTWRPDLAAQWCYAKNKGTPDDYTPRSREVVWWETAERGQWQASLNARSHSLLKPEVSLHMLRLLAPLQSPNFAGVVCTLGCTFTSPDKSSCRK